MPIAASAYLDLVRSLPPHVQLVAVSKTKPVADIRALYDLGQRAFGENYVQELLEKTPHLPGDLDWHFIGHLQTNKVRDVVAPVRLIHSVDSLRLLTEIHKQSQKSGKVTDCLLQVHIAREETKFGFTPDSLGEVFGVYPGVLTGVRVRGLMGMASNVPDEGQVRAEFRGLRRLFEQYRRAGPAFDILSMGMSADYRIAVEEGSTMIRVGSLIFGAR